MNELLEKAYYCYIQYLNRLNYGNVTQNYCLIYDAILYISNNLDEPQYLEYFTNNLNCGGEGFNIINMDILWTLNVSETPLATFDWHDLTDKVNYTFTTNTEEGYRYLYLSVPEDLTFTVYNELNMQVYNSAESSENSNQLFSFVGTMTAENGGTNNVYRKDDMFNAHNPVFFRLTIH